MVFLIKFIPSEIKSKLRLVLLLFFLSYLMSSNLPSDAVFAEEKVYSIQIGAFSDADNAREMTEDLIKLGHNSFYREEKNGGKTLYRVYIEKYETQAEAKKKAETLKNMDLISSYSIKKISFDSQYPFLQDNPGKGEGIFIHVESYNQEINAKKRINELKGCGLKAFYFEEIVSGIKWYRLYLGDFTSEEDARLKGAALINEGIINYFKLMKLHIK